MNSCKGIFTVERYIKGKVRGITVPDDALISFCVDAGVAPTESVVSISERQKDLLTAYLYLWVADGPTQWGGWTEEDADWKSSENGVRMSKAQLDDLRAKAQALLEKWGEEVLDGNEWGFVGRGMSNPVITK